MFIYFSYAYTCLHNGHLPIIAGNRVAHSICTDLTFTRTNRKVGDSVSVKPMYIIIVLSKDPI